MASLIRFIRGTLTVYVFSMIVASFFVTLLLQWMAIAAMFPFSTPEQRGDICGHILRKVSYTFGVFLNPLWWITIVKPMPKFDRKKHPRIIVMSNHLSNADPWIVIRPMGLWFDCSWAAKGDLFKTPVVGTILRNAADMPVWFTSEKGGWGTEKGSVGKMMQDAKTKLRRGRSLGVYPEGVRNFDPNGPLGDFKLGFFTLAVEEGASIVPLAMSGAGGAWPRKDWMYNFARIYSSVGEPISSVGHTPESLRDAVMKKIDEMRNQHPDRKKWLAEQEKKHQQ